MSFPFSDLVVLSAITTAVSVGMTTWWWLSRRKPDVRLALEPMTMLMKSAPHAANENGEEAAPDSSVRIRLGVPHPLAPSPTSRRYAPLVERGN